MELVVLFETGEGQTRKIATVITEQMRGLGHSVRLVNTADKSASLSLESADKVILAAPVHERRHPATFEATLSAVREQLEARPTLMLSVSLKAAFPESRDEAQDYLTEMEMRTGFKPTHEALVAGAVRPGSYDYFQSQVVRHVALAGHEIELTEGIKEFTDWAALERTVTLFLEG